MSITNTKTFLALSLLAILLPENIVAKRGQPIYVDEDDFDDRIVKGENATIEEFPEMVQISLGGRYQICAGFLVSPRHVVTAAHCFLSVIESNYNKVHKIKYIERDNATFFNIIKDVKEYFITANATYTKSGGITQQPEAIFIPRDYNKDTRNYDVAVIKLEEDYPLGEGIQIAKLCKKRWGKQEALHIAGWGYMQRTGDKASRLMRAVVRTISDKKCKDRLSNIKMEPKSNKKVTKVYVFTDTMSCALAKGGIDACGGDSGGPAYINGEVCGLVSFGLQCGRGNLPSFYTSVAKSRTFIDAAMKV